MRLKVENQIIKLVEPLFFVSGSVGIYEVEFEFSDDWAGFGKTAVFQSAYGEMWQQVLADDKCIIPHEVLIAKNPKLHELLPIRIGVYGVSGEMVKPTAWTCPLQLHIGATEGTPHVDPTPTQWEQILARLGEIDADVIVLRERVDEFSIAIDVVGTKAELDDYDTSELHPNDKVKVLADETHSDKTTYWKWTGTAWEYVGMIDTGYTKTEADAKFETRDYAEKTYETQEHAEETYETQEHAEETYETQEHAGETYETQEHAGETYKTIEDADAEFEKVDNKTDIISPESTNIQYPSAAAVFNALKSKSNSNLLVNGWFTINELGLSEYNANSCPGQYTVSMWRIGFEAPSANPRVTVHSGYVTITSAASGEAFFSQRIERGRIKPSTTYTVSVLFRNGTFYEASLTTPETIPTSGSKRFTPLGEGHRFSFSYADSYVALYFIIDPGLARDIKAIKLEEGGCSTLPADNAPDYATEYASCQRFLKVWNSVNAVPGFTYSGQTCRLAIPTQSPMRTTPVITMSDDFEITLMTVTDAVFFNPTNATVRMVDKSSVQVAFEGTGYTASANTPCVAGVRAGKLILLADL